MMMTIKFLTNLYLDYNVTLSYTFLPLPGWAMQSGGYIFLKRRWEEDKSLLSSMVDYYSALKHQTQVIFST